MKCTYAYCRDEADPKYVNKDGLCPGHIRQSYNGGLKPKRLRKGSFANCLVPGCENEYSHRGFCRKHAERAERYKLDVLQFIQITQDAVCAACDSTENLHIDHDHACCPGKGRTCGNCVRGVLCGHCNHILGKAQDDRERLMKLVEYLDASR
jgi:hypothetical protein